jgi:hypothetical protein
MSDASYLTAAPSTNGLQVRCLCHSLCKSGSVPSAGAFAACCNPAHDANEPVFSKTDDGPRLAAADALHEARLQPHPFGADACRKGGKLTLSRDTDAAEASTAFGSPRRILFGADHCSSIPWCPRHCTMLSRSLVVDISTFEGYCGRISERVVLRTDRPRASRKRRLRSLLSFEHAPAAATVEAASG